MNTLFLFYLVACFCVTIKATANQSSISTTDVLITYDETMDFVTTDDVITDVETTDDSSLVGQFSSLFTKKEYKKIQHKRVRRNIYSLSESEWNDIADAMNIMKIVPDKIGRKIYGKHYRSFDSLVCQHARATMHRLGDMGHFQAHFLLWHRAFLLVFENSLISINNNIKGVPYWNYYDDAIKYGNDLTDALIFSEKYLGDFSGNDEYNGAVTNGKFPFWKVVQGKDAQELGCPAPYQNAYGFLRQRNNPNDNVFVTRYGGLVCDEEFTLYSSLLFLYDICKNEVGNTMQEFYECMDLPVHGSSHAVVGGTRAKFDGQIVDSGCITLDNQYTEEVNNIRKYALNYGCFNCPPAGSCKIGVDSVVECAQCTVANENATCNIEGIEFKLTGELDPTNQHLRGDFFDLSTGANDPIFMFHHANVDRYMMEWQLLNYEYNDPYYGYQTEGYETGINLDDVLSDEYPFVNLFKGKIGNNGKIGKGPYTNRDILDGTQFLKADYTYDTIHELIKQ